MNFDSHMSENALTEGGRPGVGFEDAICFGPFVLLPQQHLLFKHGEPVPLGSRAMLLLIGMATRAGELLDKSELLALAWPRLVVEECNLRAQILTLRRALGDNAEFGCIVTVPGRGYRFVAPISAPPMAAQPPLIGREPPVRQPGTEQQNTIMRPVFGRDSLLGFLETQLELRRFVTITGHAGTGKTTVARALAERMLPQFPDGISFIDLAPVSRGQLVHVVIAAALGIDCTTEDPLQVIAGSLVGSKTLLILDNCEHVLEDTADAIETILRNAAYCSVLVTSREPLRAEGEFVHDLAPLAFPAQQTELSATQALGFAAIELLVERIAAHDLSYVFSDQDAQAAAAICRKLDGNALAIEIAAARVRAFGISELVEMLDGSFRLQMTGRRTALPRHRTLSAALDWTYAMLSPQEQAMLRQLSVFNGPFTLRAVQAVIDIDAQDSAQRVESLMDKSLVIALDQGSAKRYRLLETTRLYAAQKLSDHVETDVTALRHANWTLNELKTSVQNLVKTTPQAWLAHYATQVDSVRAALEWAYSPRGDRGLAVELTLVSVPLWLRLTLTGECYDWVSRGLQSSSEIAPIEQRQRMMLLTVSASVMVLTFGGGAKIREAWLQVSADARALGDTEHQLRALWGQWNDRSCGNQYVAALDLAEQYVNLSRRSEHGERQLLGLRMRANALFHMGRLDEARHTVIEALSSPLSANTHLIDLHFDQRIAAQSLKAQIHLLQGDVGPALLTLEKNVSQAISLNHPATLWYTLCLSAIPTTLLVGQLQKTRYYLAVLQDSMAGHELYLWRQFTRCFEYILLIRQGAYEDGVPRLGEVLEQLQDQGGSPLYSLIRSEYAQGLVMLGLEKRGLEIIDQTLQTARNREERWFVPELLRIKAQLLLKQGRAQLPLAHRVLRDAQQEAHTQGASFWSARIAADLARLQAADSRESDLACSSGS
ncbi:ATP-binding protein [Pseudomonas huanghezhanensis]|uniref:ATP-binding protein n=1 Tax=Pseudomonas huanghezhanensis TaxID=3002903 RepID=UPI002285CB33|nr:winged helix-turn-helix domain-containing protein [Pseudomonas sp. BSw22131]